MKKLKFYNKIKNLMLASATASLYLGFVVDAVGIIPKVIGTLCVFTLIFVLMNDADKGFIQHIKEGRKQDVH